MFICGCYACDNWWVQPEGMKLINQTKALTTIKPAAKSASVPWKLLGHCGHLTV